MFQYIVAIATAVSISICATPVKAAEQMQRRPVTKTAAPALPRINDELVSVTQALSLAAGPSNFELTIPIQRALTRALLRSARFLD